MISKLTATAVVAVGGSATVTLKTTRQQQWRVSQVSIEMANAGSGAFCALKLNGYAVTAMVPNMDAAGGDPPVDLGPSDSLTVEWTGCTVGSVGKVTWFYEVIPYA